MIYSVWHTHLGDCWASVNHVARRAIADGRPRRCSRWAHDPDTGQDIDVRDVLEAIVAELAPRRVEIVDERGDHELTKAVRCEPYLPTTTRWQAPPRTLVCYALDGVYAADRKCVPAGDADRVLRALEHPGYATKRLGKPMTIHEIVEDLSACALSVTVDNGIAHIAHSVGCPRVILEYDEPLRYAHRGKRYARCKGTRAFLRFMRQFWLAHDLPPGGRRWTAAGLAWLVRWRSAR